MKVYFRVDASENIGTGHVMRCLSLASHLKEFNYEIFFVSRPQPGDLLNHIKELGYKVIKLSKPKSVIKPKDSDDYKSWLQVREIIDAKEFESVALDAEVIIVDHYGINLDWERYIKSKIPCKLVVIDDLVRRHDADLIIDQTYGVDAAKYLLNSKTTHILAGSRYAMLNNQFSYLHKLAKKESTTNKIHKLLLSMGGVDKTNTTLDILKALSMKEIKLDTTVLLSQRAPNFKSVKLFCKNNEEWITHIPFSENMAQLMFQHTIAIGASGSTSWERACMGLPSIIIPLAKNQLQISTNLVKAGCAIELSHEDINKKINLKLEELIIKFDEMKINNFSICDGMGCQRVVKKINKLTRL